MCTNRDIINIINQWAPSSLAWEKDNIGLIIGDPDAEVKNILITLDVIHAVIDEAINYNCNLIIAHHPIIFQPIKSIHHDTQQGKMLYRLIQNNISVIAAHTNVDSTFNGLNYHLAKRLGLENIQPLDVVSQPVVKLIVHVRTDEGIDLIIRDYLAGSNVLQWNGWKMENGLSCYEFVVPQWRVSEALHGIQSLNIKEMQIIQSVTLNEKPHGFGLGAYGDLTTPMMSFEFINTMKDRLNVQYVRTNCITDRPVYRIAVCGGAGSSLLQNDINVNADIFITSDITYHTFFENSDKIILVDAGHYETEVVFIDACREWLNNSLRSFREDIRLIPASTITNPIRFM